MWLVNVKLNQGLIEIVFMGQTLKQLSKIVNKTRILKPFSTPSLYLSLLSLARLHLKFSDFEVEST